MIVQGNKNVVKYILLMKIAIPLKLYLNILLKFDAVKLSHLHCTMSDEFRLKHKNIASHLF